MSDASRKADSLEAEARRIREGQDTVTAAENRRTAAENRRWRALATAFAALVAVVIAVVIAGTIAIVVILSNFDKTLDGQAEVLQSNNDYGRLIVECTTPSIRDDKGKVIDKHECAENSSKGGAAFSFAIVRCAGDLATAPRPITDAWIEDCVAKRQGEYLKRHPLEQPEVIVPSTTKPRSK